MKWCKRGYVLAAILALASATIQAADSTGYYKNQGTAQNIQLELQDDSGNTLNTGATKTVQVDDSSQSAHFPLQVRALTVNGGATQGTIQAVISITYTYS
ncbi:fimbrial protein [Escherichia coli]